MHAILEILMVATAYFIGYRSAKKETPDKFSWRCEECTVEFGSDNLEVLKMLVNRHQELERSKRA